ncbi:MAG: thioredoxin domain-containing protein [Planctomycetota bacterium]
MIAWSVPICGLCLLATAVALRLDHWQLGIVLAGVTLFGAIIAGIMRARPSAVVVAITVVIAATRLMPDAIWPCPISCQGGALYQELFGVSVSVWAVAGLLVVCIIGLRLAADADSDRRKIRSYMTSLLLWTLAGGSVFFLWIAWRLDMHCGYCVAVHTGVLAAAGLFIRQTWWNIPAAVLGFLVLLMAYGYELRVDTPTTGGTTITQAHEFPGPDEDCPCFHDDPGTEPEPIPIAPEVGSFFGPQGSATVAAMVDPTLLSSIDSVRRLGSDKAPMIVEVAIDLHCPHCATALTPLMRRLKPLANAGRIEVIERFMLRRSNPHGAELAGHVLAAGTSTQFQFLVSLLVGSRDDAGWMSVRSRVAEIADPILIETAYAANRQVITAVLDADGARLNKLQVRQTPFVVLSKRTGEELHRWVGDQVDPAAIVAGIP